MTDSNHSICRLALVVMGRNVGFCNPVANTKCLYSKYNWCFSQIWVNMGPVPGADPRGRPRGPYPLPAEPLRSSGRRSRSESALHFNLGLPHYKILDQPFGPENLPFHSLNRNGKSLTPVSGVWYASSYVLLGIFPGTHNGSDL